MWAGLAILFQAHYRGHICDTPDVRVLERRSLEEVLSISEQFVSRSSSFSLSICEN